MTFQHCKHMLNYCNSSQFLAANSKVMVHSVAASPLLTTQKAAEAEISDLQPVLAQETPYEMHPAQLPPTKPKIRILGKIGQPHQSYAYPKLPSYSFEPVPEVPPSRSATTAVAQSTVSYFGESSSLQSPGPKMMFTVTSDDEE